MDELMEAINAVIDARLTEHGLLEEKKTEKTTKAGTKKGKKDEVIDADTLKEAFVALVNAKGKDEAKNVLKKLKVAKLSEIEEDDYEKALGVIKSSTGEEDDDLLGD